MASRPLSFSFHDCALGCCSNTAPAGMKHVTAGHSAAMDLSCLAYLARPCRLSREPLVISTYPTDRVTRHLHSRYERLDPVITQALQNPEPFRWGPSLTPRQLSSAQHGLFCEASEFGIRFGFTVPIHDGHGPIAALTFATDEKRPPFESCINSHARAPAAV